MIRSSKKSRGPQTRDLEMWCTEFEFFLKGTRVAYDALTGNAPWDDGACRKMTFFPLAKKE